VVPSWRLSRWASVCAAIRAAAYARSGRLRLDRVRGQIFGNCVALSAAGRRPLTNSDRCAPDGRRRSSGPSRVHRQALVVAHRSAPRRAGPQPRRRSRHLRLGRSSSRGSTARAARVIRAPQCARRRGRAAGSRRASRAHARRSRQPSSLLGPRPQGLQFRREPASRGARTPARSHASQCAGSAVRTSSRGAQCGLRVGADVARGAGDADSRSPISSGHSLPRSPPVARN